MRQEGDMRIQGQQIPGRENSTSKASGGSMLDQFKEQQGDQGVCSGIERKGKR